MLHKVNLDALLPREDFEGKEEDGTSDRNSNLASTFKISELSSDSIHYTTLRKPDFQRQTCDWTPARVAELVTSFVEGDLIPAVILWRSPTSGNIFVIDGAHRLSALAAWVHDDYGDSHLSRRFFDNVIPPEQAKAAAATRRLINTTIGSYSDLISAARNQDTAPRDKVTMAKKMSLYAITLQWVSGGVEKAEDSFFRINQQAVAIHDVELNMIKSRRKPNALAARAFIRAGTGHKYWSAFSESVQNDIEALAREVHDLIFRPWLEDEIRTSDLPVAGRGSSPDGLQMVFALVNYINGLQFEKTGKPVNIQQVDDDNDGAATIRYMQNVRRAAIRLAGNNPASLGLHPVVYFYSATGLFQPAAFLATVSLVRELEINDKLFEFTRHREAFEDFLVDRKYLFNQIVGRYGSLHKSRGPILMLLKTALDGTVAGLSHGEIFQILAQQDGLTFLKEQTEDDFKFGRNFTKIKSNATVLRQVLLDASRCGVCNARILYRSITVDHKIRKQDGGIGSLSNAQLTHPFCNSGFKESAEKSARVEGLANAVTPAFQTDRSG